MAKYTGKHTRVYIGVNPTSQATPAIFIKEWDHNSSFDAIEATTFEDKNMTYVAGEADASGSYSGYCDDATAQLYTASRDGQARRFYFYPDTRDTSKYTFGWAIFSWTESHNKTGIAEMSGSWNAASDITKVPYDV